MYGIVKKRYGMMAIDKILVVCIGYQLHGLKPNDSVVFQGVFTLRQLVKR